MHRSKTHYYSITGQRGRDGWLDTARPSAFAVLRSIAELILGRRLSPAGRPALRP